MLFGIASLDGPQVSCIRQLRMQKNLETLLELSNLVALWRVEGFLIEQAWSICMSVITSDELAHYFVSEIH